YASPSKCGDRRIDPVLGEQCDQGPGCDRTCRVDPGGTGALGIVTVDGLQKLYLPLTELNAGQGEIAVVDIGVAGHGVKGAGSLIKTISPGDGLMASATAGSTDAVVATSTLNRTVWFIDPKTDTVESITLDENTLGKAHFSGTSADGAFVTGVTINTTGA